MLTLLENLFVEGTWSISLVFRNFHVEMANDTPVQPIIFKPLNLVFLPICNYDCDIFIIKFMNQSIHVKVNPLFEVY